MMMGKNEKQKKKNLIQFKLTWKFVIWIMSLRYPHRKNK